MEEEKVATSGQTAPESEEKNRQGFDLDKAPREDLVAAITQLNQQCQSFARQNYELRMRLMQVDYTDTRLHYLFKVLENRNAFGDSDYIIGVCDEIKKIMSAMEPQEPEKN